MTTRKATTLKGKSRIKELDTYDIDFDFASAVEEGEKLSKKQKGDLLKSLAGAWPDGDAADELMDTYVKIGVLTPRQGKLAKRRSS